MPSRMAARSRGPPRPTANRDNERARSGAACSRERVSARAAASPAKLATESSRLAICSGSVSGADSRWASSRDPAAVTVRSTASSKRAAPVSGQRAHQFEIAAGRLIDRHAGPGALAQGRRQRRSLADLRAFDIGHARCGGRDLKPCQRPESLAGRHGEERGQPPLSGCSVKNVARERCHRRQRAPERGKVGLAVKRVRNDDFTGLEPGDLGGQHCSVAFGNAEFTGRNIDPGKREAAVVAG